MMEYFAYKKFKKHRNEKEERQEEKETEALKSQNTNTLVAEKPAPAPSPVVSALQPTNDHEVLVLDDDEKSFLERLALSWNHSGSEDEADDGEGKRPPLPPRMKTPDLTWDSDTESFVPEDEKREKKDEKDEKDEGKGKEKETAKDKTKVKDGLGRRLSHFLKKKENNSTAGHAKHPGHLAVPGHADVDAATGTAVVGTEEEVRERDDIARVLEELDQAAAGDDAEAKKEKGKGAKFAMALSAESSELVRRFVLVLKDLVNGVPTAADDLRSLLDDRDGTLSRGFQRLPSGLRKLVAQMPSKLTSSLAPELLAAAAESQGLAYKHKDGDGFGASVKNAAKTMALPLMTNPRSIVTMLKAIMNALKLRWPAFIGTSAIWSVALFILLFVLWYCHKRGREVRLEKEGAADATAIAGPSNDDDGLPVAPVTIQTTPSPDNVDSSPPGKLPPPPIGDSVSKKA